MANLYERVVEWNSREDWEHRQVNDYQGNQGGTILSSTLDNAFGRDTDKRILDERTVGAQVNGKWREKQVLDYDVLMNQDGGLDENWLSQINGQNNFSSTNGNTTNDLGGFRDMDGSSNTRDNVYEGTWNQQEVMDINIKNGRNTDTVQSEDFNMTDLFKFNKDDQITSVKGIVESTALNEYFFSDMNKDVLHDAIRARVWKNTNEHISKQSDNELFIIMRSIMLQFANFTVNGRDNLISEIQKLNMKVLDYCSENVSSNVMQQKGYISDLERLPVPIDRAVNVYDRNNGYAFDLSLRNAF